MHSGYKNSTGFKSFYLCSILVSSIISEERNGFNGTLNPRVQESFAFSGLDLLLWLLSRNPEGNHYKNHTRINKRINTRINEYFHRIRFELRNLYIEEKQFEANPMEWQLCQKKNIALILNLIRHIEPRFRWFRPPPLTPLSKPRRKSLQESSQESTQESTQESINIFIGFASN